MLPCKSLFRGLAITALLVQCCLAQRDQQAEAQSSEPWVLKEMMLQSQPETGIALLDQFHQDFQKAELIPWAFDQICEALVAAGRPGRALAAAERLLTLDPQEVEIAQK